MGATTLPIREFLESCFDGTLFSESRYVLDIFWDHVVLLLRELSHDGVVANSNWKQEIRGTGVHILSGFNCSANFAFNMFDSQGDHNLEMLSLSFTLSCPLSLHISCKLMNQEPIFVDVNGHLETIKIEHEGTRDDAFVTLIDQFDPDGSGYHFITPDEAKHMNT